MTPLQSVLLEMVKWFHNFCEQHGLRYYAVGGTMLGAARHQGFIPWDDDIDVGMPRADYDKLATLMKEQVGRYVLETPDSGNPDFCYPFSKLYDTATTLIESKRIPVKRGVFIDIFPLDGLGDTKEECLKYFPKIDRTYKLFIAKVGEVRKGRSFYKNMAVRVAGLMPRCLLNPQKLRIRLNELCRERDFDKSRWGGNLLGAWGMKEIMPTEFMGTPTKFSFEDGEIYGAENYDAYLTNLYGDWRQLPPKEKQVTHHDFIECDLNQSYLT